MARRMKSSAASGHAVPPRSLPLQEGHLLVSQWTGNEYKQMEKVFVGVVAGAADPDVVKAVRAVLDFVYYAHYEAHTEDSLSCLQEAWTRFHSHKHVFVRLGVRNDFIIPKLHSITHYVDSIRLFGTADGYNTEGPERFISTSPSMDAVWRFDQYIEWFKNGCKSQLSSGPELAVQGGGGGEEEEAENIEEDVEGEVQETAWENCKDCERYTISKCPAFPNTSVKSITKEFVAPDFVQCLKEFVSTRTASPESDRVRRPTNHTAVKSFLSSLKQYTTFSVYKQFKKDLPLMSQVSKKPTSDSIRAMPAKSAKGLRPATLSQFLTVLAYDGGVGSSEAELERETARNPLKGLMVCQIRLLFRLPSDMEHATGSKHPHHSTGMTTPLRHHRRQASIIPITAITALR
ncbi:hypothetical protein BC835DRAFT_1307362 [Cytidiella melzeri]|nr:hypothetical protein BC835DRAFT_1307362 [Cytidiella melzeri]